MGHRAVSRRTGGPERSERRVLCVEGGSNRLKGGVFSHAVGARLPSGLQKDEHAAPEVPLRPGDGSHRHGQPQGAEGHPHAAEDPQASSVSRWKA